MSELEPLLASYLDLARHIDPLRYPEHAPPECLHRLGRFDAVARRAHVAALRSVANAIEDLETIDQLDDEVDRTMLLDAIRTDVAVAEAALGSATSNPMLPLAHLDAALVGLMGEDFDARSEAALRDRVGAVPEFLASLREDARPAPPLIIAQARIEPVLDQAGPLDAATERLDDAAVQPALVAAGEHRAWLQSVAREGGDYGWGSAAVESCLARMASEPLGVKGTLRLLELRRGGVDRSLAAAVAELGDEEPLACAARLGAVTPSSDMLADFWQDEWRRVWEEMRALGLPVVDADPPDLPATTEDGWSMAAHAVRDHGVRMLLAERAAGSRPIRVALLAPGLLAGWGRTVAALLRGTDVFGLPERRVMMSYLALQENVAAESDLMLHAGLEGADALLERSSEIVDGGNGEASRRIVNAVACEPLGALAAGLAHEAWQSWYAEVGGDPVVFLLQAMRGGGLSVHLARWAMKSGRE
ncbi:MAG TPA: hypothetical protein VGL65_01415 [Gemmatimonadales bacterium]|jgi:hypothetical protein